MKKVLLGLLLLSSLSIARDIEECNGLYSEMDELSKNIVEFSTCVFNVNHLKTIESVNELEYSNSKIENLLDHIMYYHHNELDTTQTNSVRKFKVHIQESEKIIEAIRKEIDKHGK